MGVGMGGSGVVIQVENYILSADSGRTIDTDLLAEYGEAGIDIGFRPAKFRVARPTATGRRDENDTVNVYPSGKVVCLGAKSVQRARADVRMVLRRLGVVAGMDAAGDAGDDDDGASVRYVVMSGCIFGGHDANRAIPRLRKRYEVTLDTDVFSGYFVRSRGPEGEGGGVSIQVFAQDAGDNSGPAEGGRTPLLCRGPTVQDIRRVVGDVYRTIAGLGAEDGVDGAERGAEPDGVQAERIRNAA